MPFMVHIMMICILGAICMYVKMTEKLRRYALTKGNQEKTDRIIDIIDIIDLIDIMDLIDIKDLIDR